MQGLYFWEKAILGRKEKGKKEGDEGEGGGSLYALCFLGVALIGPEKERKEEEREKGGCVCVYLPLYK